MQIAGVVRQRFGIAPMPDGAVPLDPLTTCRRIAYDDLSIGHTGRGRRWVPSWNVPGLLHFDVIHVLSLECAARFMVVVAAAALQIG